MAEVGRGVRNTIAKPPITFAMIELADSADCNARKSQWLGYGFKDVTPKFASRSTVPSLNGSMVPQGRDMLHDMVMTDADWYMVSGHQGALYSSDYAIYTTDGVLDVPRLYNDEEYCGFFNEAYHEGRWDHASRADPNSHANANEIYLRATVDEAPAPIANHKQDNPLFDLTAWAPEPKGIILSACNTLAYTKTRIAWSGYFPNAVIFGTMARIVSGTWVTNAIASASMTNEQFWRDPKSVLDKPGACEELEKQLTAGFPKSSKIGFIYKKTIYLPEGPDRADFRY